MLGVVALLLLSCISMSGNQNRTSVKEVAAGIYMIDTMMSDRAGYTSVFLVRGDKAALLDSGVSVTAGNVLEGIKKSGTSLHDIGYIALTHAHYDHAGGAHKLVQMLKEAGNTSAKVACAKKPQVYLSRADICEKLMRSGKITEGELAGDMEPVSEDDFLVLEDGDLMDLGGLSVKAIDSPGHANGHLVFLVPEREFLFVGDACGLLVRDPDGAPRVLPTSFAPEYRHDTYIRTVRDIIELAPSMVGFAHFGVVADPVPVLETAVRDADNIRGISRKLSAGEIEKSEAMDALEEEYGPALKSLYGDPCRCRVTIKALLSGMLNDLSR